MNIFTAQKLMAGLISNSMDTLLEVNAAAEARSKLNEFWNHLKREPLIKLC